MVPGVSTDRPEKLKAWRSSQQLNCDLLSDPQQRVIREWQAGISLPGLVNIPLARRSCRVIDEQGILIEMQVGIIPDDSVQLALRALQGEKECRNPCGGAWRELQSSL